MIRELRRSPVAVIGLLIVMIGLILALAGPQLAPNDPLKQNFGARLKAPSGQHLLGTDHLGRDVFSRVLWGARMSVPIGLVSVSLALVVGVAVGLTAGYHGGIVDDILMRLVDILLCFPTLLLSIALVAALGGGPYQLIAAMGLAQFPRFARVARAGTLQVMRREYVEAAQALGKSAMGIAVRHVLPNMMSSIVVLATLSIGGTIITESSLSFLGLGISPTIPTWGGVVSQGLKYLRDAWWISGFGSVAIVVTVLGYNLLGDALRDALDPRLKD